MNVVPNNVSERRYYCKEALWVATSGGWVVNRDSSIHAVYINTYIQLYRGIYTKHNVNEGVPRVWSSSDKRARVYRFLLVAAVLISSILYYSQWRRCLFTFPPLSRRSDPSMLLLRPVNHSRHKRHIGTRIINFNYIIKSFSIIHKYITSYHITV